MYEAPHRLGRTLEELSEVLGDRKATLCRELTKKHETVFVSTLYELCTYYQSEEPKGECVLVIQGKSQKEKETESQEEWMKMPLEQHMAYYENQGFSRKDAMKLVAKDRGVSKREIYQKLLTD